PRALESAQGNSARGALTRTAKSIKFYTCDCMADEKQIRWVGSAYDDLLEFPRAARKEAGFELRKVQAGLEPADWKPFEDGGAGQTNQSVAATEATVNGRVVRMDCQARLEAGRSRRNPYGFTPASLRCREQKDRQVHHRYAG